MNDTTRSRTAEPPAEGAPACRPAFFAPSLAAASRAAIAAIALVGAGLATGAGRASATMPIPGPTHP